MHSAACSSGRTLFSSSPLPHRSFPAMPSAEEVIQLSPSSQTAKPDSPKAASKSPMKSAMKKQPGSPKKVPKSPMKAMKKQPSSPKVPKEPMKAVKRATKNAAAESKATAAAAAGKAGKQTFREQVFLNFK